MEAVLSEEHINEFKFCPECGSKNIKTKAGTHWTCPDCGYDLYNNNAAAVGLFLVVRGKLLVFRRVKDPQKGRLGLPGGFVNKGETLEEACIRECREEICNTPPAFEYLCSFPNTYPYKTLVYSTCDAFFYAEYNGSEEELLAGIKTVDGEAENCQLVPLATLDTSEIAFESMRKAVKILRNRIKI